ATSRVSSTSFAANGMSVAADGARGASVQRLDPRLATGPEATYHRYSSPAFTPCTQRSDCWNSTVGRRWPLGVAPGGGLGTKVTSTTRSIWSPGRITLLQKRAL